MGVENERVPLVIYHANCADGFGAAWAVWSLFRSWEYMAGWYGMPLPDVRGRAVYLVDFSFKRDQLYELARSAESITIIDHHESAIRELAMPFSGDDLCPIHTSLDLERSGAILTWRYFTPGIEPPELLRYIEDRDLWRKALPGSDEVTFALRQHPLDFDTWDALMYRDVGELIAEGGPILRYFQRQVEHQLDEWRAKPMYIRIGQDLAPVYNSNQEYTSELAQGLAEGGYRFGVVFQHDAGGIKYSLRSQKPNGQNVSEIAELCGGGGHRHSAAFRLDRLLPMGPSTMFEDLEIERERRYD
jgi:oligoribonuclease NrnB/cAMP/cGMP phosphodiesterase (DHH superfamily)